MGFSLELYTYLVHCNTITPYGSIAANSTAPSDTSFLSLDDMASFPTFGALFAGSHDLYFLIPEISVLGARRLAEEASGSAAPSDALKHTHENLYGRLKSWHLPPPRPGESADEWDARRLAGNALREAMHIFLATAMAGSVVSDPEVLAAIAVHIVKVFIDVPQLMASNLTAAMLWPVVIAGSCIVEKGNREILIRETRSPWWGMKHLNLVGDVLQLLWDDPDPRAYGPYGLSLIMEKHGVRISIA